MGKPCTGCPAASRYEYKGKEYSNPGNAACIHCKKYEKYQQYLQGKAKYKRGKKVKDLNEFDKLLTRDGVIYINYKIWNASWAISLQYRLIATAIKNGRVHAAIKKEATENHAG